MIIGLKAATLVAAIFAAAAPSAYAHPADTPEDPLGTVIDGAIHAGGPFFTPAEQAVINRKCGYPPGQWDGHHFSVDNGVFECPNGKKVDDPEVRALLRVAQPRITARITAAMARPEVQAAIAETASKAVREALANLALDRRDSD
jgi:hypothetical protein